MAAVPALREAAAAPTAPLIAIDRVGKVYASRSGARIAALQGVSLDIGAGEVVALVGPSGCGKSTLLRLIGGLDVATEGALFVGGTPVRGPTRSVGFVFQDPVLLPWRDVLGNVLFPAEILGLDRKAAREEALALLRLVGLEGFERHMPSELSGGMQSRVAISRALLHRPEILLMDEPFAALDALTRDELGLEVLRIWGERRTTMLLVTHSIQEAVFLADRVVVMSPRPGRIADVIEVRLPRPRQTAMLYAPAFRDAAEAVRSLIYARPRDA